MQSELELITAVFIVLAIALAILAVGHRLRLPLIIVYFLTGIVAGPSALGLLTTEQVSMLSELGVILLMFTIGLEISVKNLIEMKKVVFVGGTLQLVLTTAAVWALMVSLGLPSNAAILIGFLAAHSSTAIIMTLYQKSGEINSQHGKMALGMLIFQDLNVVPMMMAIPLLAGTAGTDITTEVLNFGFGMAIMCVILVAAIVFVPRILFSAASSRSNEIFVITVVAICFGIAWMMSLFGVSLALGAFLAGVAISGSDLSHEVIGQVMPIRDILTSFFFVSIGLMLDVTYLIAHFWIIIAIAAALLIGKTIINYVSLKLIGVASAAAFLSAVGLSQIGEFSFILGSTGLSSGILTNDVYQIFLAISIVTMAATPMLVRNAPKVTKRFFKEPVPAAEDTPVSTPETGLAHSDKKSAVIVGYGIAGRYAAEALKRASVDYTILELNPKTVQNVKKDEKIIFGDAGRDYILNYAGIPSASHLLITIPDANTAKAIITAARRINPSIRILTRSRFISDMPELYKIGADEVAVDERETAVHIFKRIIHDKELFGEHTEEELDAFTKELRIKVYDKYISESIDNDVKKSKSKIPNVPKIPVVGSVVSMVKDETDELLPDSLTLIKEITIAADSEICGIKLSELHLRSKFSLNIIAVKRRDSSDAQITADGNTVLHAGDTAVIAGEKGKITEFEKLFSNKGE